DPGVTILEQLCYALTDLLYRAAFPVADLLTRPPGSIDWAFQGLLPPEDAFPCRPTTAADFEAVLADALMNEAEAVSVEHMKDGLYRITICPRPEGVPGEYQEADETDSNQRAVGAEGKAVRVFHKNRNLCEDIGEIRTLRETLF